MSRLHPCNIDKKTVDAAKERAISFFVLDAAPALIGTGHLLAFMKTLAWIQDGSKPTAMVVKDELLPCLKHMILFDEEGWGALREYVLAETKETDASLGIDLGAVGSGGDGPRSDVARGVKRGPGGSVVITPTPPVSKPTVPKSVKLEHNRAKKRKHNGSEDVGGGNPAKRQEVFRGEHTSEELKHDGSESEVETPDPDYEDDGFVVDDDDELEFESDADSEDIPHEYELE